MKSAVCAVLIFSTASSVFALNTAYEAMRVVGTQRGEKSLANVVEVHGSQGAPQPALWKILARADKGLKEFQVQGDKITGERVIKDSRIMATIDLNKLNLDSDGAHTLAEREAKSAGFAYDVADYTLKGNLPGAAPVWQIRLVDQRSGKTISFDISADTGTLVSPRTSAPKSNGVIVAEGNPSGTPPVKLPPQSAPQSSPQVPVQPGGEELPPLPPDQLPPDQTIVVQEEERNGSGEELTGRVNHFIKRVGRHMDRRMHQLGDKLHNTFTGEDRDSGEPQREREESSTPAPKQRPQAGERPRD